MNNDNFEEQVLADLKATTENIAKAHKDAETWSSSAPDLPPVPEGGVIAE